MRLGVPVLALACVLVAVPAAAVDRVVDDKGVACLSGRPLHTSISAAVAAASPGETILVCAGTYNENVTVTKADLTLQGQDARLRPGNANLDAITVVRSGVTIQGFDISGFNSSVACGVLVAGGADRADIRDNRVHDNASGICLEGGTDHHVRYNVIQNNTDGIVGHSTTGPVEISNNTVKNSSDRGLLLSECSGGAAAIDQNALTSNLVGMTVLHCDAATITNNTVRGPGASTPDSEGIFVFRSTGLVLTRNLVQNFQIGVLLRIADGLTASFNSVSFNGVGLDVVTTTGATVTRNNVSRSTTLDCRWDTGGANVLTNNNCGTQNPAAAFD